jgi:hypothetical protein
MMQDSLQPCRGKRAKQRGMHGDMSYGTHANTFFVAEAYTASLNPNTALGIPNM